MDVKDIAKTMYEISIANLPSYHCHKIGEQIETYVATLLNVKQFQEHFHFVEARVYRFYNGEISFDLHIDARKETKYDYSYGNEFAEYFEVEYEKEIDTFYLRMSNEEKHLSINFEDFDVPQKAIELYNDMLATINEYIKLANL